VDAAPGELRLGHPGAFVDDHDEVRLAGQGRQPGVPPGPGVQVAAEEPLQPGEVVADQPQRAEQVGTVRVQRVRQPLHPVPLGPQVLAGAHHHPQVVRGVEGGQVGQGGAGQRAGGGRLAEHADPREAAQRQRERQVRHGRVGAQEPAQRTGGDRFEVLDRLGLRRDEPDRELVRAEGDPYLAEVGVVRAPLPQPGGQRDRPECGRVGVGVAQRIPLRGRRPGHPPPGLGEVAQVVAALAVDAPAPVAAGTAEGAGEHAERGHAVQAAGEVADRGGAGPDEHQRHRPATGQHRQEHQHLPHTALRVGQDRRRLQHDLAARQRRTGHPGRPDERGVHALPPDRRPIA
jgi:hypothetical protein